MKSVCVFECCDVQTKLSESKWMYKQRVEIIEMVYFFLRVCDSHCSSISWIVSQPREWEIGSNRDGEIDMFIRCSCGVTTYVLFRKIFVEFFTQFTDIFRTIAITTRVGGVALSAVEIFVLLRWRMVVVLMVMVVFVQFVVVVSIVASTSPCVVAFAHVWIFIIFAVVIADVVASIVFAIIVVTLSKPMIGMIRDFVDTIHRSDVRPCTHAHNCREVFSRAGCLPSTGDPDDMCGVGGRVSRLQRSPPHAIRPAWLDKFAIIGVAGRAVGRKSLSTNRFFGCIADQTLTCSDWLWVRLVRWRW